MSGTTVILDLPMPPSVNRIWRARKGGRCHVSLSPEYQRWKREADALLLAGRQLKGARTVEGPFECEIALKRVRGDIDNRAKGLMDFLQSRNVIADDKNCERLTLAWDDANAPAGCRVVVRGIG